MPLSDVRIQLEGELETLDWGIHRYEVAADGLLGDEWKLHHTFEQLIDSSAEIDKSYEAVATRLADVPQLGEKLKRFEVAKEKVRTRGLWRLGQLDQAPKSDALADVLAELCKTDPVMYAARDGWNTGLFLVMAGGMVQFAFLAWLERRVWIAFPVVFFGAIVLLLFSNITRISLTRTRLSLGSRTFALEEIEEVRLITTRSFQGRARWDIQVATRSWGVHTQRLLSDPKKLEVSLRQVGVLTRSTGG